MTVGKYWCTNGKNKKRYANWNWSPSARYIQIP